MEINMRNSRIKETCNTRNNWSDLLPDLLFLVVSKIQSFEVVYGFRACCTSWRSAAKKYFDSNYCLFPMLLQSKESKVHGIERKHELSNPFTPGSDTFTPAILSHKIVTYCLGWKGWILACGETGKTYLLHIFSQNKIKLPPLSDVPHPCFNIKVALSSDPLTKPSNCILMVISLNFAQIAFWRHGNARFTEIDLRIEFCDIIFFNEFFYSISYDGEIWKFDVADPRTCDRVAKAHFQLFGSDTYYLVESVGELLLVVNDCRPVGELDLNYPSISGFDQLPTRKFHVYKVPLESGEWVEIKDLGEKAFFVGTNTSFSMDSSEIRGCKKNSIYFTASCTLLSTKHHHAGVFNLLDGKVEFYEKEVGREPWRHCFHSPLWVTPTFT